MSAPENVIFSSHQRIALFASLPHCVHRPHNSGCGTMSTMMKTWELAITKAAELPEAAQEQIGRELLERIDTIAELRAAIEVGVRELDAGIGRALDMDELIK